MVEWYQWTLQKHWRKVNCFKNAGEVAQTCNESQHCLRGMWIPITPPKSTFSAPFSYLHWFLSTSGHGHVPVLRVHSHDTCVPGSERVEMCWAFLALSCKHLRRIFPEFALAHLRNGTFISSHHDYGLLQWHNEMNYHPRHLAIIWLIGMGHE